MTDLLLLSVDYYIEAETELNMEQNEFHSTGPCIM